MVVLLAGVVSKTGRAVVSREFVPMSRSRVESLLQSFPRLVSPSSEHTMLEANGVRYVYAPLEELYVLVATNIQSNILLDLQTLQLVSRIVIDFSSNGHGGAVPISEYDVLRVAFDIICAWDECVTLGYPEGLSVAQIRTNLEMDSHEEHIQEIIAQNKEMEAREELKRRAKLMELQKRESRYRTYDYDSPTEPVVSTGASYNDAPAPSAAPPSKAPPIKAKGLQLARGGRKTDGTLKEALAGLSLADADGVANGHDKVASPSYGDSAVPAAPAAAPAVAAPAVPSAAAPAVPAAAVPASTAPATATTPHPPKSSPPGNPFATPNPLPVYLALSENLSVDRSRDGDVAGVRIRGLLELKITDAAFSNIVAQLAPPAPGVVGSNDLQFKTHPNVDKDAWTASRQIRVKPGRAGFPVNSNALPLLRWNLVGKDESVIPISVDCWPLEESPAGSSFSIEFDLLNPNTPLAFVKVFVPLRGMPLADPGTPSVGSVSVVGDYLVWDIGHVDADAPDGSLVFAANTAYDALFPLSVDFHAPALLCGLSVDSVLLPTGASVPATVDSHLATADFTVT